MGTTIYNVVMDFIGSACCIRKIPPYNFINQQLQYLPEFPGCFGFDIV